MKTNLSPQAALRRRLLSAGLIAPAASAFSSPAWAQTQALSIGWYPGLLGANFRRSFLDTWPDGHNARVVESFDNARFTQMQANRNRPNLHVGVFTDVLLPLLARSGLIAEIDAASVPNLAQMDARVPLPVGRFATPVTFGTWGIVYNASKLSKPITGWADLLRDDLKNYVSAPNITYNSSVYTLDALARLKGGSLRAPDAGLDAMAQIRRNGPGLWDQESIAVGWLKSGEIRATPYFSGNVLAMMRDPDLTDLRFCVPEEGAYALPLNVTRVINPSAGQQPEAFINHMLGVDAQEAWAQIGNARPVHRNARIPDAVEAVTPPADQLRQLDWAYFAEHRSRLVASWNKVVNR